jgi:peptide/nickel transport system substrate-binding protein
VVASACGSSSKKGADNTNNGPTTTLGVQGAKDSGPGVRGGSLVYGIEADTSGGWCLAEAQLAIGGIQVARAIYDTLTAPGADGKIHPYLAEAVTPSANATVWTIKLRSGIKFSDGSALDAQVVKDNLDAYRGTLPVRKPLLFTFVFSDIKSTAIVDASTVKVTMKRPWQAFPWFLWSSARLGIMGEAQVKDPKNCNTRLIGTGPFVKVSWTVGDKFVAKRNPNYWQKDSNGTQLPYLDQITFVPQEDSAKRVSALQAGDFKMIENDAPLDIV